MREPCYKHWGTQGDGECVLCLSCSLNAAEAKIKELEKALENNK